MRLTTFRRLFALLAASMCIGCASETTPAPTASPTPLYSNNTDGVSHVIYCDTPFETVSATLKSGSVDSINFNASFDPFCVAVVDVDLSVKPASGFRTSFERSDGSKYDVDWTLADGKTEGVGRGVFLIPGDSVAASTTESQGDGEQ